MSNPVLTMIPGPTPVHERVLRALAEPTVSHQFPAFVEAYVECLARWRAVARTESAQPFVVSGSGTFAMEMALVNLVAPGERLLVVSHGFFGDRWEQIAASFGIECDLLRAEGGRAESTEDWSAENTDPATIAHVAERVADYLAPETLEAMRGEWLGSPGLQDMIPGKIPSRARD